MRDFVGALCRDIDHPHVREPEVPLEDLRIIAPSGFGFVGLGQRVDGEERDARAVARPLEAADALLGRRQLIRFASLHRQDPDLCFRIWARPPSRQESQRAPIGRPLRRVLTALAERDLARRSAGGGDQPDVRPRVVLIALRGIGLGRIGGRPRVGMLPVAHCVRDLRPVGRERNAADVLELHDVHEGHGALVLRAGGGGRGEQRDDAYRSARQMRSHSKLRYGRGASVFCSHVRGIAIAGLTARQRWGAAPSFGWVGGRPRRSYWMPMRARPASCFHASARWVGSG